MLQKLLTIRISRLPKSYSHLLEQSLRESARIMDGIIARIKGDNVVRVGFRKKTKRR